jgi:hypothetical protein
MAIRIKAIFKRVDRQDAYTSSISNDLENFQRYVGGYIETVSLFKEEKGHPGVVLICNEEGIPKGLPYNCRIAGIPIFGDFVIVGTKGDEFCDVPVSARFINGFIEEIKEAP